MANIYCLLPGVLVVWIIEILFRNNQQSVYVQVYHSLGSMTCPQGHSMLSVQVSLVCLYILIISDIIVAIGL